MSCFPILCRNYWVTPKFSNVYFSLRKNDIIIWNEINIGIKILVFQFKKKSVQCAPKKWCDVEFNISNIGPFFWDTWYKCVEIFLFCITVICYHLEPVGGSAGIPKINGSNIFILGTKTLCFLCFLKLITLLRLAVRPTFLNSCNWWNRGNKDLLAREQHLNPLWLSEYFLDPAALSEQKEFN